jgi:hypothetical protein
VAEFDQQLIIDRTLDAYRLLAALSRAGPVGGELVHGDAVGVVDTRAAEHGGTVAMRIRRSPSSDLVRTYSTSSASDPASPPCCDRHLGEAGDAGRTSNRSYSSPTNRSQ